MADADPGLDLGIEAVLSDGTVLSHLAGLVKDNTGYDFPSLLAGSEGTLAVITAVRLWLVPRLRDTVTALAGVSGLDELHALARLAASCSCPRGRPDRFWATDQSVRLLLIAVPGGIEGYFPQINNAPDDGERHRIGELYGIRVV